MNKLAWSGVRARFGRFMLTAFAVLLGVSFVGGSFLLTDALSQSFSAIVTKANRGTDVYVRGASESTNPKEAVREGIDIALVEKLKPLSGVERAAADIRGSATVLSADETPIHRGQNPTIGMPFDTQTPGVALTSGRAPDKGGEVVVSEATATAAGVAVDDSVKIMVGEKKVDAKVVGLATYDNDLDGTVVFFAPDQARELFVSEGQVPGIRITARTGVTQNDLLDQVAAVIPSSAEAITGKRKNADEAEAVNQTLGFVTKFLLVFAVISLVVGAFIIINTFTMLLAQRSRELALLRALGASRQQITRMVLLEALVVGVLGGLSGVLLGWGLAWGLLKVLSRSGVSLPVSVSLTPKAVGVSIATGLVVTVIAAVLPAVRASKIPPVSAMRLDLTPRPSRQWVRITFAALSAVGAVALLIGGQGKQGGRTLAVMGIGSLLLMVAMVAAAPFLTKPILKVLAAPFMLTGRLISRGRRNVVASLAERSTANNPNRTALTASALMVGLTLVTGVSVLSASAERSTKSAVEGVIKASFVLSGGGLMKPAVATEAAAVDGVAQVVRFHAVPTKNGNQVIAAAGVTSAQLTSVLNLETKGGSLQSLDRNEMVLSEALAKRLNVGVGDMITLTPGISPEASYKVGGIMRQSPALPAELLMSTSLAEAAMPEGQRVDAIAFVVLREWADPQAVRNNMQTRLKAFSNVSIATPEEVVSQQAKNIQNVLTLVYALLGLSVVVAILGIINTLALSVLERTREIGLLRAVGMTRGQMQRTIAVESVLTALFGAVLGIGMGLTVGLIMQRAMSGEGLTELSIPYGTLVGVFFLALVVGVLAAIAPAMKAGRANVLAAVASQ